MVHLYLVRHGQTVWNVERRRQGRSDSALTEDGIKQAQSVAKALEHVSFDLALSSPSKRAVDTAAIILNSPGRLDSGRHLQLVEDENLYEMGFGVWEGKSPDEMKVFQDENEEHFWKSPTRYRCPQGGESFEELIERTEQFLDDITGKRYQAEHILAVSHTATIKAILMQLQKMELDQFWGDTFIHAASLTRVLFRTRDDYDILGIGEVFYTV